MLDTKTAHDLTAMITSIVTTHDLVQDRRLDIMNAWLTLLTAFTLGLAVVAVIWLRDLRHGRWMEDPLWRERHSR